MQHSIDVARIMARLAAIAAVVGRAEIKGRVAPDMLAALEHEAEAISERLEDLGYSVDEPSPTA